MDGEWVRLDSSIGNAKASQLLRNFARRLRSLRKNDAGRLADERQRVIDNLASVRIPQSDIQSLRVCISVLTDLVNQGWDVTMRSKGLYVRAPQSAATSLLEKERVRAAHLIERDSQIKDPATQRFIREMERQRPTPKGWKSVFSLMRDGRELSEQLQQTLAEHSSRRDFNLRRVVDPYIQVIDGDATDHVTGLRLIDIWRYFRLTWATKYNSTPGRRMFVLVRDRSHVDHPVVGIAALGSAIVQMSVRDKWIGWDTKTFVAELTEHPSAIWARWMSASLSRLINEVYKSDFFSDGLISKKEISNPTREAINRLRKTAADERAAHKRFTHAKRHKARTHRGTSADGAGALSLELTGEVTSKWKLEAASHLFRWKRATTLADLLEVRMQIKQLGFRMRTKSDLAAVLSTSQGRNAVATVLRRVRATHVGVDMLDITTCGAIAPYNVLLGGKLVALLMLSPEIRRAYENRYRKACSVIASSMAGKAIIRRPRLVLLGTTSLYGVASSQYNRLRIPSDVLNGANDLEYFRLGRTVGFGSYQFSRTTMKELEDLVAQSSKGREVNSIFGEGVSPKLRKIRVALNQAGMPSNALLKHGSPRLVYVAPLASNFRDVLLGKTTRPKYLGSQVSPSKRTADIAQFWLERWLLPRLSRAETYVVLREHTLESPVTHGARVRSTAVDDHEDRAHSVFGLFDQASDI